MGLPELLFYVNCSGMRGLLSGAWTGDRSRTQRLGREIARLQKSRVGYR